MNGKAWIFANIDKNKEALHIIKKALAIDPHHVNALDTKGFILYNLERYQEAITYYDRALAIDPNYVDALEHKVLAIEKALAIEKLGEKG